MGIFFLLFSFYAFAEDWKGSLNGSLDSEYLYQAQSNMPDNKDSRGLFTLKAPGSIRYGKKIRLKFLPEFSADPQNISKGDRYFFNPQEFYLQWNPSPWTLQAGFNTLQWGDTDVFNPMDVINPRRYADPLRSEKIGTPMVLLKRDFESFFIEGIYLPIQPKTKLPGEQSRWLPRDVYNTRNISVPGFGANTQFRLLTPSQFNFTYREPMIYDNALKNNFAARVKIRLSGFDWTLAGYQGVAMSPSVNIKEINIDATDASLTNPTLTVDPDIALQAAYYKVRMTGTSFSWVLGSMLLMGASAYTNVLSKGPYLPRKVWENVLGLERNFSVGKNTLTAILQGTYIVRDNNKDKTSVSLAQMFDRAAMLALRYAIGEKHSILLSYLRDTKFKGNFLHSELSFGLADSLALKFSGDMLLGAVETPIGTYRKNSRGVAGLSFKW